jgi:hypothetical protein
MRPHDIYGELSTILGKISSFAWPSNPVHSECAHVPSAFDTVSSHPSPPSLCAHNTGCNAFRWFQLGRVHCQQASDWFPSSEAINVLHAQATLIYRSVKFAACDSIQRRTRQTERRPIVCEVRANLLRIERVAWSAQRIPTAVFSISRPILYVTKYKKKSKAIPVTGRGGL